MFQVFHGSTSVARASVLIVGDMRPVVADFVVFVERFPQEGTVGFIEVLVFYCLPDCFVIMQGSKTSVNRVLGDVKHLCCAPSPIS